jgi:erythronate-4-phosphate dehydrogenase
LGIDNWECTNIEKPQSTTILLDGGGKTVEQVVCEAVLATYVIDNDSDSLKDNPKAFEKLRGDYPVRREFTVYTVNIRNASLQMIHVLKNFGFKIIES